MRVTYHKNAMQGADLASYCRDLTFAEIREVESSSDLLAAIEASDILMFNNPLYSEEFAARLQQHADRVKLLQLSSTGYDALLQHGVPAGVAVCNAAGVWAPIVAEHACALTLAHLRGLNHLERDRQVARWDRPAAVALASSLEGARVGIVGFGTIGREMAKRIRPFDARVVAIVRRPGDHPAADEVCLIKNIADELPKLDIVICSLPLTAETDKLIDRTWFERMKPSALFVNVGRGGTVDQHAMSEFVLSGRIRGAALDVTEVEPMPSEDPLWSGQNLVLSPHMAAFASRKGISRLLDLCKTNIVQLHRREPLTYQIMN